MMNRIKYLYKNGPYIHMVSITQPADDSPEAKIFIDGVHVNDIDLMALARQAYTHIKSQPKEIG